MKKYLDIRVSGTDEDIIYFLHACALIQKCCRQGASRNIILDIDGDGSTNLSFARLKDGEEIDDDPWFKTNREITDAENIKV